LKITSQLAIPTDFYMSVGVVNIRMYTLWR